jgi:ribosomal protein S18 acetylase RimI-like enzyme
VVEFARGLSQRGLVALAELEARVVASDGGRLKLEWGVLRSRAGRDVEDLLWWDGDRLIGFLGLYALGSPAVEITGMVDPCARRRGIATALLDAALPICLAREYEQALIVTPRGSVAGQELARSRGAVLEHSEHALLLRKAPTDGPADPQITLRMAMPADASDLSRLLAGAFGQPPADPVERLADESGRTLMVEFAGATVGTVRVTRDQNAAGVYGFAVDPAWQGRGIGRDVLRRVCRQLRDEGEQSIGLEVAVDNDHALRLYTSLGFTQVTTEDYYALPLSRWDRRESGRAETA